MGQTESKKKLLFEQVRSGNVEGIRALCQDGASLEWTDKEGNTPLILACMDKKLYDVAQVLIELGANVNACRHRPAPYNESPLYHAAIRGYENRVKLLLSNGANRECRAVLERARNDKFTNIVHAIESHICLFSGWMREFYGHAIINAVAPQLLSRNVWVVILPNRFGLMPELVVYASPGDAQPQVVMTLNPNLRDPQAFHPNTSVTIIDNTTKKTLTLAASVEEGREQLTWFCRTCRGIRQPRRA